MVGLSGSPRKADKSQTGATAKTSIDRRVAAMYLYDGQSCVVRRTQFAVREIGSENTLRRPLVAKIIIMNVDMRKSGVSRRGEAADNSKRSTESAMANTIERKNAKATRC